MPKVNILCITYNHEKFIRKTLDSFVMQKTNFPFEVIIGDDCSTDKNPEIIKEYAEKYPDIIKPVLREKNIGAEDNYLDIADRVNAEYVAICEGDDYWTDPLKLQKQVDFLESNPECSICFHPVRVFYEDGSMPDEIFPTENIRNAGTMFSAEHLVLANFIQTNSVLYRWVFTPQSRVRDVVPRNILPGDYFIHLLHAQQGKIGLINEVMADYCRHPNGMWDGSITNSDALHLKYGVRELKFYLAAEKLIPEYNKFKGHPHTTAIARSFFDLYLKNYKFPEMKEILELVPDLFTV